MNLQRRFNPVHWILACLLLNALIVNLASAQSPSDDFITITVDNADQLELGYVLPGVCAFTVPDSDLTAVWKIGIYSLFTGQRRTTITSEYGGFSSHGAYFSGPNDGAINSITGEQVAPSDGFFSDDEKYFAGREDGVYDLATRKKLFPIGATGWFSPNSKLVAVDSDAVYAVPTGKRLYALPKGIVAFSPDSQYFGVWEHGIYEAATGKQVIESSGAIPIYSTDSQYVSMYDDAVYNLKTRQKVISLPPKSPSGFSSDNKSIAVTGDGLYDLATGKKQFRFAGNEYATPHYFGRTKWLGVDDDGIYDLSTNIKKYDVTGYIFSWLQDGSLFGIDRKGIFETNTGTLKFQATNAMFAANDKLILSFISTSEDLDGLFCAIYGVKGDKWSYRSGLVDTAHTQIYDAPNGNKWLDAQGRPLTTAKQQAVFAETSDKKWLKIGDSSWVKASDVQVISLPEGIPIENPS